MVTYLGRVLTGMFFYSAVQAAISFSNVVSVTSRAFEFINNRALIHFGVWSLSEMKKLASVVFQLTINLQGDFNKGPDEAVR